MRGTSLTVEQVNMGARDSDRPGQAPPPSPAVIERVKDALEHLYDLSYLEGHPLAQESESAPERPGEIAGQRLRRDLAVAVESLSPGPGVPFRAPQARAYNLMIMHYVEGVTVQEAAHKLGISRRQAHRDLREAIENVAAIWWARRCAPPDQSSNALEISSIQAEVARLEPHFRPTDLRTLLQRAGETVERLAAQRHVHLHAEVPAEPVLLSTDPVVAEQVLVHTLSHAVQQACPGALCLSLIARQGSIALSLRYLADDGPAKGPAFDLVVAQLADRLGWVVEQGERPEGSRTLTLRMARRGPAILVIDDNEGLVRLVERYLTDHAYRVVPAVDGQEGLRLAQDLLPDAIVLDVMMPGMHGWEVLQRLRNHPKTGGIPVIICSVFNNPELAYSLGASFFLPKPISRDDVLDALRQLNVV